MIVYFKLWISLNVDEECQKVLDKGFIEYLVNKMLLK